MRHIIPYGFAVLTAGGLASACWSEGAELPGLEADGICTSAPCDDALGIDITKRDEGLFFPGTYGFIIEIESGDPKAKQCVLDDAKALSCSGAADVSVRLTDELDRFVVTISDASPDRLLFRVSYENGAIGEDLLVPEYQYISDGDPDCGITCIQGTAALKTSP